MPLLLLLCIYLPPHQQRLFLKLKTYSPNLSLIMPSMPAILDTLLAPNTAPSLSRRSPEGRSITSVWAEGEEGDVKA